MTIKLIALDLDGTLLTSEKTIDPLTKEKLQEAMKMGVHIVIATGRDKGGITFVSEPLGLENGNHYVAGVNGQIIYDFKRKEYTVDDVFDGNDARHIMKVAKKYNFEAISCCGYDHYDYISRRLRFMKKLNSMLHGKPMDYGFNQGKRRFITIHDENFEITQDINKFVLIQTASFFKKYLPVIKEELEDYDIVKVGEAWIEVMPKGVSKGSALSKIGEKEGISSDEMMAFVDGSG